MILLTTHAPHCKGHHPLTMIFAVYARQARKGPDTSTLSHCRSMAWNQRCSVHFRKIRNSATHTEDRIRSELTALRCGGPSSPKLTSKSQPYEGDSNQTQRICRSQSWTSKFRRVTSRTATKPMPHAKTVGTQTQAYTTDTGTFAACGAPCSRLIDWSCNGCNTKSASTIQDTTCIGLAAAGCYLTEDFQRPSVPCQLYNPRHGCPRNCSGETATDFAANRRRTSTSTANPPVSFPDFLSPTPRYRPEAKPTSPDGEQRAHSMAETVRNRCPVSQHHSEARAKRKDSLLAFSSSASDAAAGTKKDITRQSKGEQRSTRRPRRRQKSRRPE